MKTLKKLWAWYNDKVYDMAGSEDDPSYEFSYDLFFVSMGEWIPKWCGRLFRKVFPMYVPKDAKEVSDRQFRLRVLLLLILSAVAYGIVFGFEGLQYMFVSLPVTTMASAEEYSYYVSGFYLFASTAVAMFIQNVIFVKLFGKKEYKFFSVNGILFWLMGLFLLNVVDGGIYAFAGMIEGFNSGVLNFVLFMIAGTGMIVVLPDHVNTVISFYLSYISLYIFKATSKVWAYAVYLPGTLVARIVGLSEIFDMQFFYNLSIVIITYILTVICEKTGLSEKIQRGARWFSVIKNMIAACAVSIVVGLPLLVAVYSYLYLR